MVRVHPGSLVRSPGFSRSGRLKAELRTETEGSRIRLAGPHC